MTTKRFPDLTDAQRDAARNGYDPDHTLDDQELAETALDGLRFAAAELRRQVDELETLRLAMRQEDDRTLRSAAVGEAMRRLAGRADELDPPTS